ncbi:hypothetical protein DEO72_LG10g1818 [Vigna unguiculata]|uniref:Uncharacterized protein n=1 Tax=Vigna unguiculata TaxID=3917 RepID=A0A4D6NB96_VIGUN|nr:hypothetical protein DEO72_LG10g1818 [Vigna unguiculata]
MKRKETYIISDVGLLELTEERNTEISLRRDNFDERIGVAVQQYGGIRFKQLAVDHADDSYIVVGFGGGSGDAVVLVHRLHELADHWLHFLLPPQPLLSFELSD